MNQIGSLKWLWATLLIIGIIIFGFLCIWLISFGTFFDQDFILVLIPLAVVALLILELKKLFSRR